MAYPANKVKRITSGGQTGVDRAALDFALENNIEINGFVPRGRRAEDGEISEKYTNLRETETDDYAERTRLNVINSDATLVLSRGKLSGGSLLTLDLAKNCGKPFLHTDFSTLTLEKAAAKTYEWLAMINCENLNIAGPRASEDAEIYQKTRDFLALLFTNSSR